MVLFPTLARAQFESVTRLTATPLQYQRADFVVMLHAEWTNSPYASSEVRLDLDLTTPAGKHLAIPGYYETGRSGAPSVWKVRFTPVEAGTYEGTLGLTNHGRVDVSTGLHFAVAPAPGKGFLHPGNIWSLRFDDGSPFRGIGENIAWESRARDDSRFFENANENPRYNYEYMLGQLAADGGNFFRTWMCPWNLPLEWKTVGNTNRYRNDEGHFNASAMQRMDQLVDLAAELDIYMMLTLDNSGDFQTRSFRHSNYSVENGGPLVAPQDFFTDPRARAQYKDRLRYLVARWGWSPHIAAWEFFNEIDNLMYGLPQRIPDAAVVAWHREMSDYLREIDPYHHLVTTSISHRSIAGLYEVPGIDFNQVHIYGHDGQSHVASFPEVLLESSRRFHKPLVIGECGFEWDWNKNFDDCAAGMNNDFKRALWLGLFSPTPVLPLSWWWEYFDQHHTTPYIARVRAVLDQMLAAGHGNFAEMPCRWDGPAAEVQGVRCGETAFVLLHNESTNRVSGTLELPDAGPGNQHLEVCDPEQDTPRMAGNGSAGSKSASGLTLEAGEYLILRAKGMSAHVDRR